jgi:hypothetical protein
MLPACIEGPPVQTPPVPDQPTLRAGVHVLPEAVVQKLSLQALVGLPRGGAVADLTPEQDADRHRGG